MIAATMPIQRPRDAKLLVVDAVGHISHHPRSALAALLVPGDLVVANDAATLPASLFGTHVPTGCPIEIRLAARTSLAAGDPCFTAVVFGAGDFRTRTEDRPLPPRMAPGDSLQLGPLRATVLMLLDHPRLVSLRLKAGRDPGWIAPWSADSIRIAHAAGNVGHLAGCSFEAPSAVGTDWRMLANFRARGVRLATPTHGRIRQRGSSSTRACRSTSCSISPSTGVGQRLRSRG